MAKIFLAGLGRPGQGAPPLNETGRRPSGGDASPNATNLRQQQQRPASNEILFAAQEFERRRLTRQRQIARVYTCGPRVIFELIAELVRRHNLGADPDELLAQYKALDPGVLAVLGADRFPPVPLHIVGEQP
jgi:hypothetical protein